MIFRDLPEFVPREDINNGRFSSIVFQRFFGVTVPAFMVIPPVWTLVNLKNGNVIQAVFLFLVWVPVFLIAVKFLHEKGIIRASVSTGLFLVSMLVASFVIFSVGT